ncbi:hypothetical protein KY342_00480 [Candidatus Woesearchaeota archaeon]|nr:hypothetical protein [Candidatus Woesearchaeota archaeon]
MTDDFKTDRIENEKGYGIRLTYSGKGILIFEQRKDLTGINDYCLNYNIFIPSRRNITDNVGIAVDFLKKLEQKGVRGFIQALKDADMYYGTIFEGRKPQPEVCGYSGQNPNYDMDFDAKKIKRAIKDNSLDHLVIKTQVGNVLIRTVYDGENYQNFEQKPESEITVDGFDSNIAEELKDLLLSTCNIDINENDVPDLMKSLEHVLEQYKTVLNAGDGVRK